MTTHLTEISLLFILASALGVIAKFLKQPLILAYLAVGAIIAYFGFFQIVGSETISVFSDLGIMFLLFLVGLEINYTSLRLVGKMSLIVGVGQILLTTLAGLALTALLGFGFMQALYIAVALTFSSTIIIVKLLSDKKDLNSLYGKISIGLLLVQDLVAILILVMLYGIQSQGGFDPAALILTILKAVALFAVILWLGRKALPHLFDEIAHSQELLFLCSTAWVFLVAAVVSKLGFSVEIAGFLAGLGLANSSENFQIANRIRPLRDFFILIFFVILGSSFATTNFSGLAIPIIVLSLFVIIGNPLIMLAIMGGLGFKKRTSFLAGLTMAQISEFSLIMAALGLKIGHIDSKVVAVTITASSYLITNSNRLYRLFKDVLWIFEKKEPSETQLPKEQKKPLILIGFHRTGQSLARFLPKNDLVVIDFDPEMTKKLDHLGYSYVFGDISDPEIFDMVSSRQTKLVISTSPDIEDNLLLISMFRQKRNRPSIIVRAESEKDAITFYNSGADYVLVPHFSSGHHLGKLLADNSSATQLKRLRERDYKILLKDIES
jgi:Kef-type K+ transport system membrane component KefB